MYVKGWHRDIEEYLCRARCWSGGSRHRSDAPKDASSGVDIARLGRMVDCCDSTAVTASVGAEVSFMLASSNIPMHSVVKIRV